MTSWNRMTSSPEKELPIHRRGRIAFGMLVALLVGLAATAALYIGKVPADLRGIRVERDEDVVFTQKAGKMLSDDRKADPESIQSDDSKQTVRTYKWIDHIEHMLDRHNEAIDIRLLAGTRMKGKERI